MPDFEFEFNQQDKDLVLNQTAGTFGGTNYIRLTIYPTEAINNIVDLPDETKGVDGKAIFFSTLNPNGVIINISPFTDGNVFREKALFATGLDIDKKGDFKIYRNETTQDIYIKPNEIFNDFELPEGNYRIQIDFLNQVSKGQVFEQNLPIPYWFEDFDITGDGVLDGTDAVGWTNVGRQDIADIIVGFVTSQQFPPSYYSQDENDTNQGQQGGDGGDVETNLLRGLEYFYENVNENIQYKFIIKQISTSRKEVRLKILDDVILNNSNIITKLTNELNQNTDKYQFKHMLNVGTGDHNPIMNFAFDAVTDGKDNQSIILKLYEPLTGNVQNLSMVTIEREVLTTQIQDIFYFSDVPDVFFGDGLVPQQQEDWINPDNNDLEFQSLNEIAISSSIDDISINTLISSSEYNYPNLNTNFNEFENHTFFGSVKKKLENFKTKVETIQGHYSDISSSLSGSGIAIGGDAYHVVQKRKNLFNKVNEEFKTFTPFERFLYFDGQSESSASAPSLKNYAETPPVGPTHDGFELNQYDGFNVVYQRTNDTASIIRNGITPDSQKWIGITQGLYNIQKKPFFNYSGSVYLSFLMKGDDSIDYIMGGTKELEWDTYGLSTAGNGLDVPLPKTSQFRERLIQPSITGSEYRRFVYHSSQSYWIPNEGIDFSDLNTINNDGDYVLDDNITILSGSVKTGSYQVKDTTNKYPTTVVTQSGVPFFGSCMPAGEIFRLFFRGDLGGITSSFMTDVKVTLDNPIDVLPFDNVFKTTSDKWNDWYNDMLTKAENFDTDNIHSFENNLPLYIQESSDYNDMKDFLNLQGEQYDMIRNHIDSMGTIHKRGYKKTNSPPDNTLPMLLSNMGWEGINPFEGNLTETLGGYLSGITSIDDIKNNTWRKTLNNLLYIYKSKGTKNSVRALLNTYGYPPDIINFKEFGGAVEPEPSDTLPEITFSPFTNEDTPQVPVVNNGISIPQDIKIDTNLNLFTGSFNFISKKEKFYRYRFAGRQNRVLNLDWWMDDANINTFQFVYKHDEATTVQEILKSSGSNTQSLWDLRLVPDNEGISSSFEFRLNNSPSGSSDITGSAVSMSTAYSIMTDGQVWNVMLQRMTSSILPDITHEYRLHAALQNNKSIVTYNYVTMSVAGASSTANEQANRNFIGSGSRDEDDSSNLFVGRGLSGSIGEIRGWTTALSTSRFRQHTLNKFSIVGNNFLSHCKELRYHFKLNENYGLQTDTESGSGVLHPISSPTQNMTITDSAAKHHLKTGYNLTKLAHVFLTSSVYGFDIIDSVTPSLQDNSNTQNDNNILINPSNRMIGNLNSKQSATLPLTDKSKGKQKLITSTKLELYRSPQNFVNDFIIGKIGGFNLQNKYGNPTNFYSQSYNELTELREEFFDCYEVTTDTNKFIRSHESMFNHSLGEGIKQVAPARSTFSDKNSNFGVEIKPTILERQKYENHDHTVEVNPNTGIGTIDVNRVKLSDKLGDKQLLTIYDTVVEGTALGTPSTICSFELPISSSLSRGYLPAGIPISESSLIIPSTTGSSIVNPYNVTINTQPTYGGSTIILSKDGTIDYSSDVNKSYVSVHKNWGTSSSDTHFLNYASSDSGSHSDYNVGHIDTRFIFHMIGDSERYSASNASDFSNSNNFYDRKMIDTDFHADVSYESFIGSDDTNQTGRMMGKTRYFITSSDGDMTLPRNHVTKFSQPFKEQMINGTQNTNPGQLNVQYEDYSTASFYSVLVTGGENQIRVNSGNPSKGGNDNKIIYR